MRAGVEAVFKKRFHPGSFYHFCSGERRPVLHLMEQGRQAERRPPERSRQRELPLSQDGPTKKKRFSPSFPPCGVRLKRRRGCDKM